jgi:hypothetical protein
VDPLERLFTELGRRFRDLVGRDAVRWRPGISLPDAERGRIGVRANPQPAVGIGPKLLEIPAVVCAGSQQIAAPLDAQFRSEFLFELTQPDRYVVAPGSEIVGIHDQMNRLHAPRLSQRVRKNSSWRRRSGCSDELQTPSTAEMQPDILDTGPSSDHSPRPHFAHTATSLRHLIAESSTRRVSPQCVWTQSNAGLNPKTEK